MLLDQTRLPGERVDRRCATVPELCAAIRELAIRGAPAIGIAAAMGMAQAARRSSAAGTPALRAELAGRERPARGLAADRRQPRLGARRAATRWSRAASGTPADLRAALVALARRIHDDEVARCVAMGGTAPSCCPRARACSRTATRARSRRAATARRSASSARRTRRSGHPRLGRRDAPASPGRAAHGVGARRARHPAHADRRRRGGQLFCARAVDAVVFGADRIARNGDAANKIGTYALSVLARAHGVPFYVAAPSSTIDLAIASGAEIPIEQRAADEVARLPAARSPPRVPPSRTPPSTSRPPPTSPRS